VRLTAGTSRGAIVDLRQVGGFWRDAGGIGTVHHVAFRVANEADQEEMPGGVLFEVATDVPGFTVDEAPSELGGRLTLPPWLEPDRARIEAGLPALSTDLEVGSAAG